jgi:hypothetical protein
MSERWTKPRPDGEPHNAVDPVECAHCSHVYQGFDYFRIVEHCRDHHPEFYARKIATDCCGFFLFVGQPK